MSLVAWYKLNDNFNDSIGNNNLSTTLGGSWVEGKTGKAFSINGTGGSATMAPLSSGLDFNTNVWSISMWVKVDYTSWSTIQDRHNIFELGQYYIPNETSILLGRHGNTGDYLSFSIYENQVGKSGPSAHSYTTNEIKDWIFLSLNCDGTTLTFNSFSSQSKLWRTTSRDISWNNSIYKIRDNFILGGYGWDFDSWRGIVGDVKVHNNSLSEKEIRELGKAKILHYTFNDFQEPTVNLFSTCSKSFIESLVFPIRPSVNPENGGYWTSLSWNGKVNLSHNFAIGDSVTFSGWYMPYSTDTSIVISSSAGVHCYSNRGMEASVISPTSWNKWYYFEQTVVFNSVATSARIEDRGYDYYNTDLASLTTGYWCNIQVELKDHVTPFILSERTGVVTDVSGYSNDAILTNLNTPNWTVGKLGSGSYQFNGINKFLDAGSSLLSTTNANQEFTLSGWIYTRDVLGEHWLIDQYNYGTYRMIFSHHINGLIRYFYNGTSYYNNTIVLLSTWSHIVVNRSSTGVLKFYLNGKLDGTSTSLGVIAPINTHVGNYMAYDVNYSLDDVRIYTSELSDDDVLELYQTRAQLDNKGNLFLNELNVNGVSSDFGNLIKYQYWIKGNYNSTSVWDDLVTSRKMIVYERTNFTNRIELANNPIGELDLMYNFHVDTTHYAQYAHPTSYYYVPVDPTKTYRFSQWIYLHAVTSTTNNQPNYLGILANTVCYLNTETLQTNPYFCMPTNNNSLFADKWVLQVYYVYAAGTTGQVSYGTLHYSDETSVNYGGNFTWAAATTSTYIRQYHMYEYDEIKAGSFAKIYRPRMEILDDNAPTIEELVSCSVHRPVVNTNGDSVWDLKSISESGQGNFGDVSEVGITDGLVGWWKLDGDAKDYSGNEYNGTVTGARISSGLKSLAYEFEYTTDQIRCISSPSIDTTFSISSWFYSNNIANSQNIVSRNGPYFMRVVGSKIRFDILTSGSWLFQGGTTTLLSNTWYHFVMTYNGLNFISYINGVQEFNIPRVGSISYGTGSLNIGYTTGGEDSPMNGKLADIRFFNRALSADEISILYKFGLINTGMQVTSDGMLYTNKEISEGL